MTVEKVGSGYEAHVIEWGEYLAYFQRLPAGAEFRAYYHSRECPQLGYVCCGKLRFVYEDGSEAVVSAGEMYYVRSPYSFEALEDTETVEFSPTAAYWQHLSRLAMRDSARDASIICD